MKESIQSAGLNAEGLATNQLCASLEECYNNLDNNIIETENDER